MKRDGIYTLVALAVLVLVALPAGIAVFVLGFIYGDSPCVMCWEQRTGMILIALTGLFVLRYGPRPRYVGLAVLQGAAGLFMGLRHTALHAARDVGQGFSIEILGAHTYTWSLFIFWVCVVAMGAFILAARNVELPAAPRVPGRVERAAFVTFFIVVAANAVQALVSTGPPPFMGQSDPVRFSFLPRNWVWSLDEWNIDLSRVSLRGRWDIEKPGLAGLNADPSAGPLAALTANPAGSPGALRALTVRERRQLTLPLRGTPTDLAYDAGSDRFVLTTQLGVYVTDGALARVLAHTVVDPGYSVDLGRFAGAAFSGRGTVMALGENKSYVILRPSDSARADANYRYFLESFDQFDEVARGRFATVRARMQYIMSLAYDPRTNSLYTVTLPNAKSRRLVISRFDRGDLTLSEEFLPSLAAEVPLRLADRRSLDEYYVTGAAVSDGRLYAISAAYGTLLAIDLASHRVVAAWTISGLDRPVGLAIRGGEFYILGADGVVTVAHQGAPDPGR